MPRTRTFGLVPHVADDATRDALASLCHRISEDTQAPVEPYFASSPAELAAAIHLGEVHFAWVSPTLLLLSEQLARAVPLLSSVRQGVASFHALLFVASSSPIRGTADLAGRSVAWVARTSASGYIVPRLGLVRRGLDVRSLFGRQVFCDSHAAVAWRVLRGDVEVGATYGVFERADPEGQLVKAGFLDFVPELLARVIDVTGPIPADMIIADASVPTDERAAFAAALSANAIESPGAEAVRAVIGAEEFRSFSHEAVRELGELIRAGRSLGAVDQPAE